MNVRISLPVATLVALLVAIPTTLQGAPGGQASGPAGRPAAGTTANAPTAAEAARLAAAAADMAQRAAKLAEQAQNSADSSSTWRRRGETQQQPAPSAPAAYPTTSTPGPSAPAEASASQTNQDGSLHWRQIFATDEEKAQKSDGPAAKLASIGADLTSSFGGQILADSSKPAARTINDSEVVPAANAQYPETLAGDSEYALPASYDGCGGGSCSDGCCGDVYCGDMCCEPRRPLSWIMGVEATWLHPDLNDRPPTLSVDDFTFDRFNTFSANSADVNSFYISPRIWLGIQGCQWGTVVRYWHMQAAEFNYDSFFDKNGTYDSGIADASYFASGRLDAYTIDWELTRRFCVHDCQMMLSGGVRYALIQSDQSVTGLAQTLANAADDETTILLSGYGRGDSLFRGTGLVLGLNGSQPLFPCSCVQLFWNLRGSVMWGQTDTSAETFANVESFDPAGAGAAASVNGASTSLNDDLWIGEVQLGLQWDYCLRCIPARSFVRCAVEYQRWEGAKGFSEAGSAASGAVFESGVPVTAADIETLASAGAPKLDLIGLTIGAGLTW